MSLLQDSQIENSVYLCSFQCTIRQANISMKFPCSYFVEWSTSSRKAIATSSKHLPQQQVVHFDQKLILQTQMVYNNKTSQYTKKETLVQLYLVSKSRPDQNKLVGRVSIDLAKVINFQMYAQPTQFTLNFCSVQGSLTMQFHLIDQKLTTMKMQELDKSSFIDFISQIAMKNPKNNGLVKSKQNLQREKEVSNISRDVAQLKMSLRNDISDLQENIVSNHPISSQNRSSNITNQRVDNIFQTRKSNVYSSIIQTKNIYEKPIQQYTESKPPQDGVDLEAIKPNISFKFKTFQQSQNSNGITNQKIGIPPSQNRVVQPVTSTILHVQREQMYEVQDDKQRALQLQKTVRNRQNKQNIEEDVVEVLHEDHNFQIQSLQQQRNMLQKLVTELEQRQKNAYQQIQHLSQEIGTKNNIIKKLQTQLNYRDQKCEQLMQMVQSLSQSQPKQGHKQQRANPTVNELLYLQETIKKFQLEIKELSALLQEAEKREIKDDKKFCDLQQLIKTLQFQNDKHKDQIRHQLQIRQTLQSKVTEYEDIIKQLTNMSKQSQQKLTQSQINYQRVKVQMQNYEKQHRFIVDQFALKIEALKQDLDKANQVHLTYQSQNQQYVQLCNQRETQILQLKILIEQNKRKEVNTSRSVQVIQNTEKIIELQEQNKRIYEEVQFLKQSLEMLQRQSNQEIQMLKTQKNKIQQSSQQLHKQLQKLKIQHQERQNYDTQRQIGMEQILSNVNKEINAYKEQLINRENELAIQKQYNQQMIFQIKSMQNQNSGLMQQLEKYQAEIVQLHQQIREMSTPKNNKNFLNKQNNFEEKIDQCEMMISKLNANLQEQINNNNQLSQTILNYMQKQAKMKETLNVLEEESKEIFILFQEKEHNEETYQKMIEGLQKQIQSLSTNFYQIHSEESSPKRYLQSSPSLNKLKQRWQHNNEQLSQTNRKLQQLNDQLNEQLLKLKIMYNRLKEQSENQIKKLNQQIIQVQSNSKKDVISQSHIQSQKSLKNKDLELQITKSKLKQAEEAKIKIQRELDEAKRYMETLEEDKFNIESAHNEKDIKIFQLSQQILTLKNSPQTKKNQSPQSSPKQNEEFLQILSTIKQKLTNKNINADWQQMIQNILQKSLCGQDTAKLINIEQKSRLLSKELQKLKAHILKSALKNQQEKLSFMNLIKTCESIVVEIIAAAESLSLNQSSFL